VQSAQAISAAYYFDLAARDYSLADGAIELVVEGIPCSAFIKPSQRSELIFYGRSARLRGGKHAAEGGKSRRDLQGHKKVRDERQRSHVLTFPRHLSSILLPMIKTKPARYQTLLEPSITAGACSHDFAVFRWRQIAKRS